MEDNQANPSERLREFFRACEVFSQQIQDRKLIPRSILQLVVVRSSEELLLMDLEDVLGFELSDALNENQLSRLRIWCSDTVADLYNSAQQQHLAVNLEILALSTALEDEWDALADDRLAGLNESQRAGVKSFRGPFLQVRAEMSKQRELLGQPQIPKPAKGIAMPLVRSVLADVIAAATQPDKQ
jgi:hypothetical protein